MVTIKQRESDARGKDGGRDSKNHFYGGRMILDTSS